jgi:tungstate transport system ATP-binding protein
MIKNYDNLLYELTGIRQIYNGRKVLDIEELNIHRGEIFGVVGPSGAGKSTLLRLLGFLEKPAGGQLSYGGRLCDDVWPGLEDRRRVTMVFQNPHLLQRSVRDNVIYGLKLRGQNDGRAGVAEMLDKMGLHDFAGVPANTLSGGEAQRVALARALILQPDVLLLDEPTANLDPFNIKLIEAIVRQANREQKTSVIMVTHNVFQARRLADRVGLILSGQLVEVAETETFFDNPRQEATAAFVRGDIIY